MNRHYTIRHGAVDRTADIETASFKVLSNTWNKVKLFTSACAVFTSENLSVFIVTLPVFKSPLMKSYHDKIFEKYCFLSGIGCLTV